MNDTIEEFTCELCGGTFNKGRPDAEAEAEAEALWGVPHASTDPAMAVICDDCFRKGYQAGAHT